MRETIANLLTYVHRVWHYRWMVLLIAFPLSFSGWIWVQLFSQLQQPLFGTHSGLWVAPFWPAHRPQQDSVPGAARS